MQHYGEFDSEKQAEENRVCREIVREIGRFGVNDRQRLFLIYLLALELENPEQMQELTAVVRDLGKQNLLISDKAEE